MFRNHLVLAVACAFALAPVGCVSADDDEGMTTDTGYLAVNWTIGDRQDAALCAEYGAQNAAIQVFDRNQAMLSSIEVPCNQFDALVELPVDNYEAVVVLRDGNKKVVSHRADLGLFTVTSGDELRISVRFEAPARADVSSDEQ
jgi:hypothetical protein